MPKWRDVALLGLLALLLLGATVTRPGSAITLGTLTLTERLLMPDGSSGAAVIGRSAAPTTGLYFTAQGVFFETAGGSTGRFVNGSTWSNDISGRGLRIDEGGGANSILSLQANTSSTIRYDNEQLEIVLGANNVANVAIVPIASGATTGASLELRNAADSDGIRLEYLNNTTPLLTVTGSLVADRNLTVRPKNATSIAWLVQGVANQSADLQQWRTSADAILGHVSAAGALHISTSFAMAPHTVAVANNTIGATGNVEILSGLRSLYVIDCNDPDGCTIQFGTSTPHSGIEAGAMTRVVSISTSGYALTMQDVASVQHTAAAMTMGINDSMSLQSVKNRSGAIIWVETGRSDN